MLYQVSKLGLNQEVKFDKAQIKLDEKLFMAYFAKPESCVFDGTIKKIEHDVKVVGKICSTFTGVCYKCGANAKFEICLSVEDVFEKEDLTTQIIYNGKTLNMDMMATESILLNFPSKIICKQNCKGLCGICGQNLNEKQCSCETDGKGVYNPENPLSQLKKLL